MTVIVCPFSPKCTANSWIFWLWGKGTIQLGRPSSLSRDKGTRQKGPESLNSALGLTSTVGVEWVKCRVPEMRGQMAEKLEHELGVELLWLWQP